MKELSNFGPELEERLVIHMGTLSLADRADWVAAANRALAHPNQRHDSSWDFVADVVKWLEFQSPTTPGVEEMPVYMQVARVIARN